MALQGALRQNNGLADQPGGEGFGHGLVKCGGIERRAGKFLNLQKGFVGIGSGYGMAIGDAQDACDVHSVQPFPREAGNRTGGDHSGIMRRKNASNKGTVKAVSPWAGL